MPKQLKFLAHLQHAVIELTKFRLETKVLNNHLQKETTVILILLLFLLKRLSKLLRPDIIRINYLNIIR